MRFRTVLTRLFDLYVFGNLHIALCAVALTSTTAAVLDLHLRTELLAFVFCGTFFGYNLLRLPGAFHGTPIARQFKRHYWNTQHRVLLGALSILAAVIFAWSFSRLYLRSQVVALVPAALSFAYALPVIPTKRKWTELREISGLKIFVIAVTWACSCALLPVAATHRANQPWFSTASIFWSLACGLLIFSLTIPFDIRDLRYDGGRLRALPSLLGVKNSIRVAIAGLAVSAGLVCANWLWFETGTISQAVGYSLWCVVASAFVYVSSPDREEYYFSFWIDGLILLLWAMVTFWRR